MIEAALGCVICTAIGLLGGLLGGVALGAWITTEDDRPEDWFGRRGERQDGDE